MTEKELMQLHSGLKQARWKSRSWRPRSRAIPARRSSRRQSTKPLPPTLRSRGYAPDSPTPNRNGTRAAEDSTTTSDPCSRPAATASSGARKSLATPSPVPPEIAGELGGRADVGGGQTVTVLSRPAWCPENGWRQDSVSREVEPLECGPVGCNKSSERWVKWRRDWWQTHWADE